MSRKLRMLTTLAAATVLAAIAVPALAATPKVGKWTGATSVKYVPLPTQWWLAPRTVQVDTRFSVVRSRGGGLRVKRFRLANPGIKLIDCTPRAFGPAGVVFISHVKPKIRRGSFRFTEDQPRRPGSLHKTMKVRGRFTSKKRASGKLTFTASKPGASCTTGGWMKWTARLGATGVPPLGK